MHAGLLHSTQIDLQPDMQLLLTKSLGSAFTYAGPLQVSWGDPQPGLLGWAGTGGSWIAWRFPHRRRVAALLLAAPPASFQGCRFELSHNDADASGFVAVPVRLQGLGSARESREAGDPREAGDGCLVIITSVRCPASGLTLQV